AVVGTTPASTFGIVTGAGNDTVSVAPTVGALGAGLGGTLSIDEGPGSNALSLSEAASPSGDTVFVTAASVGGGGAHPFGILYAATGGTFAGGIGLVTGPGNDTIGVLSKRADSPLSIDSGAGNDTVNVAVTSTTGYSQLSINGNAGTDTLGVFDQTGGAVLR